MQDDIPFISLDTFEVVGNLMPKKVALVNLTTNTVENIIMVSTLEDPVPENYKLVPMKHTEVVPALYQEQTELIDLIKEIDPNYRFPTTEAPIEIGVTKWTEEKGFHIEEI